jgi:hypothetical protein
MKILIKIVLPLLSINCSAKVYLEYGKSWGRFGDNLLSYMHTKYISYVTGIPVAYTPFIYSDQLKLSDVETPAKKIGGKKVQITENTIENNFKKIRAARAEKGDIIFEIPYFPEDLYEYRTYKHKNPQWIFFDVDWKDRHFKAILKELVAPKKRLHLLKIPENTLSIAIHVREGGGYDDSDAQLNNPLKFPPLEYYAQALQDILSLYGDAQKYYVYIFTDHRHPSELVHYFRDNFPEPNIQFDCRLHHNRHDKNVLEDFFSLTLFDCLIRPQSNFSLLAAKIADYQVEIEPVEFIITDGVVKITKTTAS